MRLQHSCSSETTAARLHCGKTAVKVLRGCDEAAARSEDAAAKVTTTNEFGVGRWRIIERFGVEQDGPLLACDNAKQGRQNECARVGDRLLPAGSDSRR